MCIFAKFNMLLLNLPWHELCLYVPLQEFCSLHAELEFAGSHQRKSWKKWWMNSRNPPGVRQSPSGVQPEYVGECKVLPNTFDVD